MTHKLVVEWPDAHPFRDRNGTTIRILAISDILESTLTNRHNRESLGPVDLILGCGDLDFDDLAYMADAFDAPLVYVQGNHDMREPWQESQASCPAPLRTPFVVRRSGLKIAGLGWPALRDRLSGRSEFGAWRQVLSLAARGLGRATPDVVMSHVPPAGAGDVPTDAYHRGFSSYAWLLKRLRPRLWIHGHTPLAAAPEWHSTYGETEVVNVTGAVLIEIVPPGWRADESAGASSEPAEPNELADMPATPARTKVGSRN